MFKIEFCLQARRASRDTRESVPLESVMAQPSRHSHMPQLSCQWGEWRYTEMKDEDFENWALCRKCHEPLHIPKTLPCLHTLCLRCLQIHYRIVRKQVSYLMLSLPPSSILIVDFPFLWCSLLHSEHSYFAANK